MATAACSTMRGTSWSAAWSTCISTAGRSHPAAGKNRRLGQPQLQPRKHAAHQGALHSLRGPAGRMVYAFRKSLPRLSGHRKHQVSKIRRSVALSFLLESSSTRPRSRPTRTVSTPTATSTPSAAPRCTTPSAAIRSICASSGTPTTTCRTRSATRPAAMGPMNASWRQAEARKIVG